MREQESRGGAEGEKGLAGPLRLAEKTHWKRESVSRESISAAGQSYERKVDMGATQHMNLDPAGK